MHDAIHAGACGVEACALREVSAADFHPRCIGDLGRKWRAVNYGANLMTARQQVANKMAAQISRGAGDQDAHEQILVQWRWRRELSTVDDFQRFTTEDLLHLVLGVGGPRT